MTTRSSQGVGKKFDKGVVMNDPHYASLYCDKVLFEKRLLVANKELRELKHQLRCLETQSVQAVRDAHVAVESLKQAPTQLAHQRNTAQIALDKRERNESRVREHSLTKKLEAEKVAVRKAVHDGREMKASLYTTSQELRTMTARADSADARLASMRVRLEHSRITVVETSGQLTDTQKVLDATRDNITHLSTRADTAEDSLQEAEAALADAEEMTAALEESMVLQSAKMAPKRGRPAGHRGADWLIANWAAYNANSRKLAFWRHCEDIRDALQAAGYDNWLPSALAVVLDSTPAGDLGSWVDVLWATRQFAKRRNELVGQLRDVAQGEWGVDLAQHALTEVGLSTHQYQQLRNIFSRSLFTPAHSTLEVDPRSGMYSPRPWYTCPLTGKVFNLPEPLPPLYRAQALMKDTLSPMGLHLSQDGRISERSFLDTLRQTFVRDQNALKVFDIKRPAHPCFGIDHLTISGARDFTQGGLTMGGCYKAGSLLSEQKHVTLCVGLHHDDGKGLEAMLGPKEASESAGEKRPTIVGIASEFTQLSDSGTLLGHGRLHLHPM